MQHSNPVDATQAYAGNPTKFGTAADPLVGKRIGGVNVFGGGLALYNGSVKVGAIGVSGDTSCTDHVVALKIRAALGLAPSSTGGVAGASKDALIQDIGAGGSAGGFGHPTCLNNPTDSNDGGSIVGN